MIISQSWMRHEPDDTPQQPVKCLTERIVNQIGRDGPMSFRDFMDLALYDPAAGYYTSGKSRPGHRGDYFTSATLTCIFGQLIARQLVEMWKMLGKQPFTIVECGGGDGALCRDILLELQQNGPMYGMLNYYIVEKNIDGRSKVPDLPEDKVSWVSDMTVLPPVNGCILSNELLDNFPVHRVVMEDRLMEVCLDYEDGFTEVLRPAGEQLIDYFRQQQITLPPACHTEVNIQATEWLADVNALLNKGFLLTIDYGYLAPELLGNRRNAGTLRCFRQHVSNKNYYTDIGEQDITAHVNFSALGHWGKKHGLQLCGYTDQKHFLHGLGLAGHIRKLEHEGAFDCLGQREKLFLINTLLVDMGDKFKVLIQKKGMVGSSLSGLLFAERFYGR